jgi:hypothetical protein
MRRFSLFIAAATIVGFAGAASAGINPVEDDPSCFGQDRSSIIQDVFIADETTPGASGWGAIAASRGGDNAQQNIDYLNDVCGADIPADPQNNVPD